MKSKKALDEQLAELLQKAKKIGLDENPFFESTLDRYMTQISILNTLEKEVKKIGATVDKEYVKGRKNIYTNPAITEYNKTATAANGTLMTLINVMKSFVNEDDSGNIGDKMSRLMKDE